MNVKEETLAFERLTMDTKIFIAVVLLGLMIGACSIICNSIWSIERIVIHLTASGGC